MNVHGLHLLLQQLHVTNVILAWFSLVQALVSRGTLKLGVRALIVEVIVHVILVVIVLAESIDSPLTLFELVEPLLFFSGDGHGLCLIVARRLRLILQGGKVTDYTDDVLVVIVSGHALSERCLDCLQLLVEVTTKVLHAGR